MGQILHGSATTTYAVRAAIQRSKAPLKELAAQHGLNQKTVAKWRKRAFVHDAPMGPKTVRSSVLTGEEEAMVVEAPLKLAGAIDDLDASDVAVIDCLTLWLSNLMGEDGEVAEGVETLATAMSRTPARLLVVSNEVGWGIVPDNALARRFRDDAGRLHQTLAEISDEVALVVAGLPLWLKAEVPR